MTLDNGYQLQQGRYTIQEVLGEGGMGTVYLATDRNLPGRLVAIKENADASHSAQEQFQQEAVMLARLTHPNLPRVTDHFVESSGRQYLVMDYVEGDDLREVLRQQGGPLPEPLVLAWIEQVINALEHMHNWIDPATRRPSPIIHRDIKPGNIKRTPNGRIVLVDFGLAKYESDDEPTIAGARAFSPGYSPVEQYGGGTNIRSDIYALGATLYHLLTGQRPPDSSVLAGGAPLTPPRQLNPQISRNTERVVLRAMQGQEKERFQNMRAMRDALLNRRAGANDNDQPVLTKAEYTLSTYTKRTDRRAQGALVWLIGLLFLGLLAVGIAWSTPLTERWRTLLRIGSQPQATVASGNVITMTLTPTLTPVLTTTLTAATNPPLSLTLPLTPSALPVTTTVAVESSAVTHTVTATVTATVTDAPPTIIPMTMTSAATATLPPATPTPSATASATATAQPSPTLSPLPTATPSATVTPTMQPSKTPTASATVPPTYTAPPTATSTWTATAMATLAPTPTATVTPRPTATPTAKATVTRTAAPTPTVTQTATSEPSPTTAATSTTIPTATATSTVRPTPTSPPRPTATRTATPRPQPTVTKTATTALTATATPRSTTTPTTMPVQTTPVAGESRVNPRDQAIYVFVPGGDFRMGSTIEPDEQPQHTVTLADFWISQTETTNAQYARCVDAGGCTPPHNNDWRDPARANFPVTHVDWGQASAYAQWAGGHLPTEAQWEKAARGTDGRTFPWGNEGTDDQRLNFNSPGGPVAVGSYPAGASPYGALDMAGNVEEWVADWYAPDTYTSDPRDNPTGPSEGLFRVVRGGSFHSTGGGVRTAARDRALPNTTFDSVGFRVFMPAE